MVLTFITIRCHVSQRRVKIALVVVFDPSIQLLDKLGRAFPLAQPDKLFLQRARQALGTGIALGIVVAREGLADPEALASLHEGNGGRLAAVIRHERKPLAPGAFDKLPIHGPVERHEPLPGAALEPGVMANDLLGVPLEDEHDVEPAKALEHRLGHVDPPPPIGRCRLGLRPLRTPLGPKPQVGLHQQSVLAHQTQGPFLIDRLRLDVAQIRPHPPIPPEGVLGLERGNPIEERAVARNHFGRLTPVHPSTSSLFLSASVSLPTSALRRVFSRSRRASRSLC